MFLEKIHILLHLTVFVVCNSHDPEILTNTGMVRGRTVNIIDSYHEKEKTVSSFLGIPYAQPPIGNLRFKRPVLNSEWKGILSANESKPACVNRNGGDEDCLYINLWKPNSQNGSLVPVLVWIPGGEFSQAADITDDVGMNFAAMTELILVTFSYRHGPFGFLYTGDEEAPGNVGLLDQNLALKWISANILYFDGNPTKITIIGDGLGGASVNYHLLSPGSWDHFTRPIMMSGTSVGLWAFSSQKEAKSVAHRLFKSTGCSIGDSVACLRKLEARDLQEISRPERFSRITYRPFPFTPTIDGKFLTQDPLEYLRNGQFKKTEIMIGTNVNDGLTIANEYISKNPQIRLNKISDITRVINSLLPGQSRIRKAQILQSYFTYSTYNETVDLGDLSSMISDVMFICPSIRVADYYSAIKEQVYYYKSFLGSSDIKIKIPERNAPYILLIPFLVKENYSEDDRKISKEMSLHLKEFVTMGDDDNWPLWSTEYRHGVKIGKKGGTYGVVQVHPEDSNCDFWNKIRFD